jgi:hypothetical protein
MTMRLSIRVSLALIAALSLTSWGLVLAGSRSALHAVGAL